MAEARIEHGIGETRALVLDGGVAVEAHAEREAGLRAGDVWAARLVVQLVPGRRGIVDCGGVEALLEPLPAGLSEGGVARVEIVREAMPEAGRAKLAKAVPAPGTVRGPGRVAHGTDLEARLRARGLAVTPADLDMHGWADLAEAAAAGRFAFAGGLLTVSPTPAMTVIDVDGPGPAGELALAAVGAVGRAIRLFGLAGSIGVDLPTVADKALRTRLGAALDAALPLPFERTAVNGFGFVQIVRPCARPSLVQLWRGDPAAAAALALLRAAERTPGAGPRTLTAHPAVAAWLDAHPALTDELARRLGSGVALRADPALGYAAGHAHAVHP